MPTQLVAKNRKAFHNYEILDRFEAGIALLGTEVKSVRDRKVNLKDSYAQIKNGELWLQNCHISPYSHGGQSNHNPLRPRKLLLHRLEINRLIGRMNKKGFTIIPLSLYFSGGKVKVEIALGRGKQLYDKREAARRKTIDKEIETEMRKR